MITITHSEQLANGWGYRNRWRLGYTKRESTMKKHTATYLNYFGYDQHDWIPCEVPNCGKQCIDVHHLIPRSRGGKDNIENLMGLCRDCHHEIHFGTKLKNECLITVHHLKLNK